MHQRLVCAAIAACFVCASGAYAQSSFPFVVFNVFANGGQNPGQPIEAIGGAFYQDPDGDDLPPTSSEIVDFPTVEFDSYIALDSIGPSTLSRTAAGPDFSGITFTQDTLTGGWGSIDGVQSGQGPFPGLQSVFIARVTVPAGTPINAPSLAVDVESDLGGPQRFEGPVTIVDADEPGPRSVLGGGNDRGGGAEYDFLSLRMPTSFASADGRGAVMEFDVFDIYIVAVPAPGSLAMLALGGLIASRRRR